MFSGLVEGLPEEGEVKGKGIQHRILSLWFMLLQDSGLLSGFVPLRVRVESWGASCLAYAEWVHCAPTHNSDTWPAQVFLQIGVIVSMARGEAASDRKKNGGFGGSLFASVEPKKYQGPRIQTHYTPCLVSELLKLGRVLNGHSRSDALRIDG